MSESGSQEAESGGGSPAKREPMSPVGNKVIVVLGAQWGDEGKGKVVDLLAQDADMVCRCQVGPLVNQSHRLPPRGNLWLLPGCSSKANVDFRSEPSNIPVGVLFRVFSLMSP